MRKLSFKELYKEFTEPIATPREQFLMLLCEITGVSPATVSMWLSGYYTPKEDVINKIAKHFDVDPKSLFANQRTQKKQTKNKKSPKK